jgi:hypothetical protein
LTSIRIEDPIYKEYRYIFFFFFYHLDPDSESGSSKPSNPDPIRIRMHNSAQIYKGKRSFLETRTRGTATVLSTAKGKQLHPFYFFYSISLSVLTSKNEEFKVMPVFLFQPPMHLIRLDK